MAAVVMYSTRVCPYCRMAEALLARKGVQPQKILVDEDPARRIEMVDRTGRKTVPQIYIGERHVGGYAELAELDHQGELDVLLAQT
jgi:glutaredoxin 3